MKRKDLGERLRRIAPDVLSRLEGAEAPCPPAEVLRAFVERVKREKGSFENLLTISPTCPGVYPLDRILEEGYDGLAASYFEAVSKGELPDGVRDSCRTCGFFVPIGSDITVSVAGCGDPGAGCTMYLNSARAAELTEGFGGDRTDREFDPVSLDGDLSARKSARRELFAGLDESCGSLDGLTDTFGRCVGCHGCSRVCPICYCLLCDFESSNFDYGFPYFEEHLSRKGALRLPPDTMLFHLGRLTHMSFSCVGCGMCSDVCPVDIPVATVFGRTGEVTRALFDYLPGRDPEEPVPVMIFREEELSELG